MIQFRVVTVTNNLEAHPQYREDTREFPRLVQHIEDAVEVFVVDMRDGGFWVASDFFYGTNITHFVVDSLEAPE